MLRIRAHSDKNAKVPSLQPAQTVPFGTGPTAFSAFLSPKYPTNGWLWGVGPVIQIPSERSSIPGAFDLDLCQEIRQTSAARRDKVSHSHRCQFVVPKSNPGSSLFS